MLAWEQMLDQQHFHFVSYRGCDGTRKAFDRVKCLVVEGIPVFWDRWSLPRRLAERRERLEDAALQKHIEDRLAQATIVWGIDSPRYGEEGSYSARERSLAQRLGTFRVDV